MASILSQPQCVNSLWTGDASKVSWSISIQVITRCQYVLQAIIGADAELLRIGALATKFSEISIKNTNIFFQENVFENVVCKLLTIVFSSLRGYSEWIMEHVERGVEYYGA